jgi:hypothetical protein
MRCQRSRPSAAARAWRRMSSAVAGLGAGLSDLTPWVTIGPGGAGSSGGGPELRPRRFSWRRRRMGSLVTVSRWYPAIGDPSARSRFSGVFLPATVPAGVSHPRRGGSGPSTRRAMPCQRRAPPSERARRASDEEASSEAAPSLSTSLVFVLVSPSSLQVDRERTRSPCTASSTRRSPPGASSTTLSTRAQSQQNRTRASALAG